MLLMVVLRADPWMPDYGMGYEASLEDSPLPQADPFVETEDWSSPLTPAVAPPDRVWFVDGVRRIEVRLLADDDHRRVPGLVGSYAVGAVRCDRQAAFDDHRVCRAVVLGGGVVPDRARVACGRGFLVFDPVTDARADPNGPLEKLQSLMREAEDAMAARLIGDGASLVIGDGPLRIGEERGLPLVGVIKRFVRRYLDPAQEALLSLLRMGERTPLFALMDGQGVVRGYSWYARLAEHRTPWHDHAGIVRCEVRAVLGLQGAVEMADRVTVMLPRYAGRAADPRTPQNLTPVAGLESWLRHRMGDRGLIRRAVLAWIASGAAGEG